MSNHDDKMTEMMEMTEKPLDGNTISHTLGPSDGNASDDVKPVTTREITNSVKSDDLPNTSAEGRIRNGSNSDNNVTSNSANRTIPPKSAKSNWTPPIYGSQTYTASNGAKPNSALQPYGSQGKIVYNSQQTVTSNNAVAAMYGSRTFTSPYGQSTGSQNLVHSKGQLSSQTTAAPSGVELKVTPGGGDENKAEEAPPNYMWLSCSVLWCCCPVAGAVALALSLFSSQAADEKQVNKARCYGRASLVTNIVGIVVAMVVSVVISIIYLPAIL